jgi:hypothetical protein
MESIAVSIATILTEVDQTLVASAYVLGGGPLRHKEDSKRINIRGDRSEQFLDFLKIAIICDNELELMRWVSLDPGTDYLWLSTAFLVFFDPAFLDLSRLGRRVAQLRA